MYVHLSLHPQWSATTETLQGISSQSLHKVEAQQGIYHQTTTVSEEAIDTGMYIRKLTVICNMHATFVYAYICGKSHICSYVIYMILLKADTALTCKHLQL